MSIARHHAEWLSLVPVSGPFLSLPVLMEVFNTGLEPHDPGHARLLRQEYANWQGSFEKRKPDPAAHLNWIKFVLTNTLELDHVLLAEGQAISQTLQVEIPLHHELLRPSLVLCDPATKKPRMLVQTYPRSQDLDSYVANSSWKASPDTRMTELLRATGVELGLVTNGEHWMLVDVPKGGTSGFASWYAALWLEEKITLQAFQSLLSASRFFNVPDKQTLEALFKKSANNQTEVTDQLGYQVLHAVEVLIHSLDRADQDFERALLADVQVDVLYESALTVMMRLVFLFCAEERELIPTKPFPVYEQNYSVAAISKQLRELADQHGEELLERRYDAWPRLLAAFRAVFGGLKHDDVYIPAYGGSLFNPDRFPFLEGRKSGTTWRDTDANPLPVNNCTVLHLLEALQLLRIKVPGGGPTEARRVSFRALDIEQIGHVYEGLLDHTAKRALEPHLGLAGTRTKEPEIPLAALETLLAKGESPLFQFLKEVTGKSESALTKAFHVEIQPQEAGRFRAACHGDDALWKRVQPFAGLVRLDDIGYPVVIPQGSVFVTEGTDRRSSGTHYTPRELTEPIVRYTLEPLVYVGPAEGKPEDEWRLKSATELLSLKICDMACGSGAFLVQTARYLAEKLMEAWEAEHSVAQPGDQGDLFTEVVPAPQNVVRITPYGMASAGGLFEQVVPLDPHERKTYAMRIIAQRCLYGVDINPLAVEMAKLSLWLLTLARDKPFEFLDHSIRCGDSLVGLHDIAQLRHFSLKPDDDDAVLFHGPLDEVVEEAISLRLKLEDLPANSVEDLERQEKLLTEANEKIARLRCAADLLVAAEFWGVNAKDKLEKVRHAAVVSGHYIENGLTEEFEEKAAKERRGQKMFHWPLEFPEVIVKKSGFDAFVGNPPFMGGTKLEPAFGRCHREYLVDQIAGSVRGVRGTGDLCAYFFLRIASLSRKSGGCGLVATNTIAEGDSRLLGLDQIIKAGACISRAVKSKKWPGKANLEVAFVWLFFGKWNGAYFLGEICVGDISTLLEAGASDNRMPSPLIANEGKCIEGSKALGMGFILDQLEARSLLESAPKNRDVLFPFLTGEDLNSRPDQSASRWAIFFFDWPLTHEDDATSQKPAAADYPDCLQIVEQRVKPERFSHPPDSSWNRAIRERWWQFGLPRPALLKAIRGMSRVLVRSAVSNINSVSFVTTNQVFSHATKVFIFDDDAALALLQSSIHTTWLEKYASSMRTDVRYTPETCFAPFPFTEFTNGMRQSGKRYDQHRRAVMIGRQQGMTKTYKRLFSPDDNSADIQKLRELHIEIDQAVAVA
jgi:hypothetical protein